MEENQLLLKDLLKNFKEQNLWAYDFNTKNIYFDKLDDIVNEYNNTYHKRIRMKSIDVKDNTYVDSNKEADDKNSKL